MMMKIVIFNIYQEQCINIILVKSQNLHITRKTRDLFHEINIDKYTGVVNANSEVWNCIYRACVLWERWAGIAWVGWGRFVGAWAEPAFYILLVYL